MTYLCAVGKQPVRTLPTPVLAAGRPAACRRGRRASLSDADAAVVPMPMRPSPAEVGVCPPSAGCFRSPLGQSPDGWPPEGAKGPHPGVRSPAGVPVPASPAPLWRRQQRPNRKAGRSRAERPAEAETKKGDGRKKQKGRKKRGPVSQQTIFTNLKSYTMKNTLQRYGRK